jgi:uncharacterized hydrophobic protein (TIGR00271 family)
MNPITTEQQLKIYQDISVGSEPKLPFYILVILSTIIAGYGLVANSTAVVIGAMIVAPLMTPIIGIALSLVVSDSKLFRHAIAAEVFGVILSIALGVLVGKITFGLEIGTEILARTQPSPYDILVALAAGLAGAYTLVNPRLNGALAGVAIAVSLVPPLAVCGICLALERYDLAGGAFLLFFVNFLAIELAGILIFLLFGFADLLDPIAIIPKAKRSGLWLVYDALKHFLLSFTLLILLTVYLASTLVKTIDERYFHKKLETTVRDEVQKRTGARLSELNYIREANGKINVIGVVMTPQEFLPADVDKLQNQVRAAVGDNINIVIRSIISKDADSHGTIFLLDEEKLKRQKLSEAENFLSEMTQVINAQLAAILGAFLVEVKQEDSESTKTIIASVRTPVAITPAQIAVIEQALHQIDSNTRLVVRSIITRDADATRYLYEAVEENIAKPLDTDAQALRKSLQAGLKTAVKKIVKGGSLLDFQYNEDETTISLLAVIQTPQNFSSKQVRLLQNALQKQVAKKLKLIVRSVVGTDMDENGFADIETPGLQDAELTPNAAVVPAP